MNIPSRPFLKLSTLSSIWCNPGINGTMELSVVFHEAAEVHDMICELINAVNEFEKRPEVKPILVQSGKRDAIQGAYTLLDIDALYECLTPYQKESLAQTMIDAMDTERIERLIENQIRERE